ncbi:MAG TPA: PASTA domain-containing protein, partial [Nocardioidaceae bacterium]|nr:PASTA domain-containing protein [Nocardioidaceae bacterium]
ATSGAPAFTQQSTYQGSPPDTTYRWMGSAAMDRQGDLALGFSASSAAIHPEIRYAGRLAGDAPDTLAQGEATLLAGTGSQNASTHHRWGDYSDMTVDPLDDCTFWYTQEYYNAPNSAASWRTRIGNFKFTGPSPTGCNAPTTPALTMLNTADAPHVSPGAQMGFNVTLFNSGTDPATGIAVTDNLPGGSGVDWSLDIAHSDSGWSLTGAPPNEVLHGPATLNGGTVSHVHVTSGTPTGACPTYTNAASFTSTAGGSGGATASAAISCSGVTVTKAGTGSGTVTSSPAGVNCGASCAAQFGNGTPMTLTATPGVGSDFTGWSGSGCAGAGLCTFVLNGSKAVTATFTLQKRSLTVVEKGNGRGSVSSSPAGVGCPSACTAQFFYGTLVMLTPKPTATSVFSGWGGACVGKSACSVSMTANRSATATFTAKCVVPKLVGLTLKKARARIKKAHCTVGKITRKRSAKSKSGKVLSQKPRPGRKLAPAAKVSLVVGRS